MDAKKAIFNVVKAEDILNRLPLKRILGICAEVLTEDEIEQIFKPEPETIPPVSFPAPIIIPMDEEQEDELITLIRDHDDADVDDSRPAPTPEPEPRPKAKPEPEKQGYKARPNNNQLVPLTCTAEEDAELMAIIRNSEPKGITREEFNKLSPFKPTKTYNWLRNGLLQGKIRAEIGLKSKQTYHLPEYRLIPGMIKPQEPPQEPAEPKKEAPEVPQVPPTENKPKIRPKPSVTPTGMPKGIQPKHEIDCSKDDILAHETRFLHWVWTHGSNSSVSLSKIEDWFCDTIKVCNSKGERIPLGNGLTQAILGALSTMIGKGYLDRITRKGEGKNAPLHYEYRLNARGFNQAMKYKEEDE